MPVNLSDGNPSAALLPTCAPSIDQFDPAGVAPTLVTIHWPIQTLYRPLSVRYENDTLVPIVDASKHYTSLCVPAVGPSSSRPWPISTPKS